jgi:hypothetical protein
VPIIPGAVDDIGDACGLGSGPRDLLRWLAETADRITGDLRPVTVKAIAAATRWHRTAIRRNLDELERHDLVKCHLPQGHAGWIVVLCHDEIVWQAPRARRKRASAPHKHGSAPGSRGSAPRSRGNVQATWGNDPQKKKTSRAVDAAPSGEASSPAGTSPADGPSANGDTPAEPNDDIPAEPNVELNTRGIDKARDALHRRDQT